MFQQVVRVILAAAVLTTQVLPAASVPSHNSGLELLIQKAQSLEARGRQDLAAQVWQQVLIASPDQPVALAHLARWAKHNGQNEQATSFLERLRKADPSYAQSQMESVADPAAKAKSRLDEAASLASSQRFTEAMAIYREVFGSTPPSGKWSIAYYETLAATPGGVEPATAALKRLAAEYPTIADYSLSLGRLMTYDPATRLAGVSHLSNIEESTALALKAKAAWRQALLWEKSNPAYAASAKLYLSRYNDPEIETETSAIRTHEATRAVAAKPENKNVQLGFASLKAGVVDEARTRFHDALSENQENDKAHEGLGFVAMKEGNFEEAVNEFELAKMSSANPEVRTALHEAKFWKTMQAASKALDAQDWKQALDLYHSALAQRPQSTEALSGLGGALLAAGEPAKALPYLKKLVAQQPANESAWCSLVKATLDASGSKAALQVMASVPLATSTKLSGKIEWKSVQARIYKESGDAERAQALYKEMRAGDTRNLSGDVQLDLANLALELNQPLQASIYAARAVELAPRNVSAWEVQLSSLLAAQRQWDAKRLYESIPKSVLDLASKHPGFQESSASIRELNGDVQGARAILQDLAEDRNTISNQKRTALKLRIADLDAKLGDNENALTILNDLTAAEPDNVALWRSRILVLNTMKQPAEVVNSFSGMPQSVAVKLRLDGDVVSVLASAYAAEGRRDYAIRLLETFSIQPSSLRSEAGIPQKLQLGWMLLDEPNSGAYLFRLLEEIDGQPALSADSRKQLTDLWVTWILRSAEASRKSGDSKRVLALLEQGVKEFPSNPKLQGAFAGNLLAAGETKRALNVYANWGLTDAQADDFAGAVGAAMSQHDTRTAEAWLTNGLTHWPNSPKLLTQAGDLYQSKGDLKRAKAYWKEALYQEKAMPVVTASGSPLQASGADSSSLQSLLVGYSPEAGRSAAGNESLRFDKTLATTADSASTPVAFHPSSYQPLSSAALPERTGMLSELRQPMLTPDPKPALSLIDSLQDKLASIDSRNTPYVSSNLSVWERGGQAGFSRLAIQQEEIEASTTIANTLRASLLLKPTYLSGGTADGSGTSLFGQQTKPAGFGTQSQSGIAGEAELSTQSLGIRFGSTPGGFLTSNWIGGFRFQPGNGPITFLAERDSVKETMLSFAGARDPQSGQVWGGVMADSFSVQGHWGDSNSGFYASTSYQTLDGKNVAKNTAINGNFGSWWKVGVISGGNLTVGTNFSAMHYDQNLRYFTFGQGGYFSPQQYYLFSLPVRWTGTHGPLQYALGGSIGLQHFAEDGSAFYPTDPTLQAQQNMHYTSLVSTGLNYGLDGKVAYQIAPHWLLGAFATANNARDYTAFSAGIFVKYTFEERPINFMSEASSVPNWRGQDPFKF